MLRQRGLNRPSDGCHRKTGSPTRVGPRHFRDGSSGKTTPAAPGPVPVPAVPSGWAQPPANPTPGYAPAPPVTQPIPTAQGFDPRLQAAVAAHAKRGYRLVTGQGPTVTLQRPATPFNWIWLIGSFFIGVGIGGIVYLLVWLLWPGSQNLLGGLGPGPLRADRRAG